MKYEDSTVFDDKFSSAITKAENLLSKYPVHKNHVPLATILKQDHVKSLVHVATKFDQIIPSSDERETITIQSIVKSFSNFGFGCIMRFKPEDFDGIDKSSHAVSHFVIKNLVYLMKGLRFIEEESDESKCEDVDEDDKPSWLEQAEVKATDDTLINGKDINLKVTDGQRHPM